MFSNWLTRGGLVQLVAPDENFSAQEKEEADAGTAGGLLDDIFNIVAPDPNFSSLKQPPGDQNSALVNDSSSKSQHHVQCIHCHRLTPIHPELPLPISQAQLETPFFTPRRIQKPELDSDFSNLPKDEALGRKVLSAAVDLARSMSSPSGSWEPIKNFFNLCASTNTLTSKQLSKVQNLLQKDPSLINARSSKMGFLAPDGFAPIHAAAYSGNIAVVDLLIAFRPDVVHLLDVQGRTALHIASERGHLDIVTLLKDSMGTTEDKMGSSIVFPIGGDAPVDLCGRTPLAWAATSSASLAVRNRTRLEQVLFSPEDKSIVGIFTPPSYRMGGDRLASSRAQPISAIAQKSARSDGIAITYGFSEMPGMRIEMEDAMCYHYPIKLKTGSIAGFFGVFDGHGDGGVSSRFIADKIAEYFIQAETWNVTPSQPDMTLSVALISNALTAACIKADDELRKHYSSRRASGTAGGSTGVMAVITADHVVVANVGDSRCILVQRSRPVVVGGGEEDTAERLDKSLSDLSLEDDTKRQPSSGDGLLVTALSTDHKPNLPHELQRVVKAGYEVVPDRLHGDGEDCSDSLIWKIKKSDNDKIAVSRAFGDFDYKEKSDLDAHEQAIICIPEITVHERKADLDLYLVLACDGVYDVMENHDIGQLIMRAVKDPKSGTAIPEAADLLLKNCLECGSRDNMSVMIVAFSGRASLDEAASSMDPKVLKFIEE